MGDKVFRSSYYKHKIRSILIDNVAFRKVGGQRSGTLNFSRVYRAKFTDRVFSKRLAPGIKDYNVVLVCDVSGSMARGRADKTMCEALLHIVKMLQTECKLSIVDYNAIQVVQKKPTEILNAAGLSALESRVLKRVVDGHHYGNHDHMAVNKALDILKGCSGRKIVIVLTDGRPNCDRCADRSASYEAQLKVKKKGKRMCTTCKPSQDCGSPAYLEQMLKNSVKLAEQQGVYVHGIGIESNSVAHLYTNHTLLKSSVEIGDKLVDILSKSIRRVGIC